MAQILPVFERGKPEAAQAMSEPFLMPSDFFVTKGEGAPQPSMKDAELIGMATAYVDSMEQGGLKVDTVLLIDPHNRFEDKKAAASAFTDGYEKSAGRVHNVADKLKQNGLLSTELEKFARAGATFVPFSKGFLTVGSVIVSGSMEDYSSALVIPKIAVEEVGLALRQKVIDTVLAGDAIDIEGIDPEQREQALQALLTQHEVMHSFGAIGAASYFRDVDMTPNGLKG